MLTQYFISKAIEIEYLVVKTDKLQGEPHERFQTPGTGLRIPDSLSFTTDSEEHDFRLYKQKFPGFRKSGLLYMGRYIVDCI